MFNEKVMVVLLVLLVIKVMLVLPGPYLALKS